MCVYIYIIVRCVIDVAALSPPRLPAIRGALTSGFPWLPLGAVGALGGRLKTIM